MASLRSDRRRRSDVEYVLDPPADRTPSGEPADEERLLELPYRTHTGDHHLVVLRRGDAIVLRFRAVGEFVLERDRIRCVPDADCSAEELEVKLLGPVLAVFCEMRRRLALHAAAVAVDGRAVGFLAASLGGKTSLSCTMIRDGARLLTDDILAVDVVNGRHLAYPAWPEVRLWPAGAELFHGTTEGLSRIAPHLEKLRVPLKPREFASRPVRLSTLYLVERGGSHEVEIDSLSHTEIVRRLLANSFAAQTAGALGLAPERLDRVLRLADSVRFRALRYPDGLEHLPAVCRAIRHDHTAEETP